jgi:hypothetical protein
METSKIWSLANPKDSNQKDQVWEIKKAKFK